MFDSKGFEWQFFWPAWHFGTEISKHWYKKGSLDQFSYKIRWVYIGPLQLRWYVK